MAIRRVGLECRSCGCLFGGEGSFKKHRTGSYGVGVISSNGVTHYTKHTRGCLSQSDMEARGMAKNEKGIWTNNVLEGEKVDERS